MKRRGLLLAAGALVTGAAAWVAIRPYLPHSPNETSTATAPQKYHQEPVAQALHPSAKSSVSEGRPHAFTSAFAKFQTGDYEGAIEKLRIEFIKNPKNELIYKNLGTSLYALGLVRLREQKMSLAEDLFEEAAALDNRSAAAALANLRVRSGKHDGAFAALEDIFEKTGDVYAIRTLIDLALSRDDIHRAQAYLNRGESLTPIDPTEKQLLENTLQERRERLEVRKIFMQSEVLIDRGNVQVAYASPEKKRTAETVARTMEQTLERLGRWLLPISDNIRFRAVVLASETFSASTGAPPWAQGIFDGILRIPVNKGEPSPLELASAASVSRHETLHAYLYELCGDVFPHWLNEGLAQKVAGHPSSQAWALLRSTYGLKMPSQLATDDALEGNFVEAAPGTVGELYARSLLVVDAVSKRFGEEIWRTILTRTCQDKDPLSVVLTAEVGAARGSELWKLYVATQR